MTHVTIIEQNHLLRLGILHLLSQAKIASNIKAHAPKEILKLEATENCDLMIMSVANHEDVIYQINITERVFRPTAILLLSDRPDVSSSILEAHASIAGCICRHASPEILLASIQLILAGGRCFPHIIFPEKSKREQFLPYKLEQWLPIIKASPTVVNYKPLQKNSDAAQQTSVTQPKAHQTTNYSPDKEAELLGLTPRQYEVLVLLARGHPMKTVSRKLDISVATAKAHTDAVYQRLAVKNRNAAVYAAISQGATLGWSTTPQSKNESSYSNQKTKKTQSVNDFYKLYFAPRKL